MDAADRGSKQEAEIGGLRQHARGRVAVESARRVMVAMAAGEEARGGAGHDGSGLQSLTVSVSGSYPSVCLWADSRSSSSSTCIN